MKLSDVCGSCSDSVCSDTDQDLKPDYTPFYLGKRVVVTEDIATFVERSIRAMVDNTSEHIENQRLISPSASSKIGRSTDGETEESRISTQGRTVWGDNIKRAAPHLSKSQIDGVCHFIERRSADSLENVYLSPKKTGLSRALQFASDGGPFLHLNQPKEGDPELGRGGFKVVKKAVGVEDGIVYASASNGRTRVEMFQKEIEIMKQLKDVQGCLKVIADIGYAKPSNGLTKHRMLVEYCDGGTLEGAGTLSPDEKRKIFQDAIQTIAQVHERGIIHRDLKPGNFLLKTSEEKGVELRVADFGSACTLEKPNLQHTTVLFSPPEFYRHMFRIGYEEGVQRDRIAMLTPGYDVWSLGLVLGQLIGMDIRIPEVPGEVAQTGRAIAALKQGWLPEPEIVNSPQHLVWEMLQADPARRITLPQAMERFSSLNWSTVS